MLLMLASHFISLNVCPLFYVFLCFQFGECRIKSGLMLVIKAYLDFVSIFFFNC